jgi:hypothetical protein
MWKRLIFRPIPGKFDGMVLRRMLIETVIFLCILHDLIYNNKIGIDSQCLSSQMMIFIRTFKFNSAGRDAGFYFYLP